jgi:hypothetical protein
LLLKYNAKKSCIINCDRRIYEDEHIDIKMNGEKFPIISVFKYLRIEISKENDVNNQMIKNCRKIQKCLNIFVFSYNINILIHRILWIKMFK